MQLEGLLKCLSVGVLRGVIVREAHELKNVWVGFAHVLEDGCSTLGAFGGRSQHSATVAAV